MKALDCKAKLHYLKLLLMERLRKLILFYQNTPILSSIEYKILGQNQFHHLESESFENLEDDQNFTLTF